MEFPGNFSNCADLYFQLNYSTNSFFIMPSAIYVPTHATTASGRNVEFGLLEYALWDLFDTGYLHLQEYSLAKFWLRSYKEGGALPGAAKFTCVFSGQPQLFLRMLDGLFELYVAAVNNERINQSSSSQDTEPTTDSSVDLWNVWPHCIGRFGLLPQFRWAADTERNVTVIDLLTQENHDTYHGQGTHEH